MNKKNDNKIQQSNNDLLKTKIGKYLLAVLCLGLLLRGLGIGYGFYQENNNRIVRENCAKSLADDTNNGCDFDDIKRQSERY